MNFNTLPTDLCRLILQYNYQMIHSKVMSQIEQIPDVCEYCGCSICYLSIRHNQSKGRLCHNCDCVYERCPDCNDIFDSYDGCVLCRNQCMMCGLWDDTLKVSFYERDICVKLECRQCYEKTT